ncbi:hypothetical protein PV08_08920 [Exophiala spinifera]|uniref:SnoaL-like domain-containing protein n=1 Tax=Exophiala spinifera TaxID=91928 RepID=A0A0D2BR64_9EURO|nr:uncharacterized protein PV08_08920 [Exophiala spinifera]KIW13729.1 hypothetical protein PV08_08920 [Exophiala spinifera]
MSQPGDFAAELYSLRDTVRSLQQSLSNVQDIQAVQWLLNHYTALHDEACFDLNKQQEWENLFAEDGVAIYPFGQHKGREGKGAWAFGGVSYFERCQLLSSNFDITFGPGRKQAHVRTNCIAQWMKRKDVYHEHFDEGGFYNWILRKDDSGQWKIQQVKLTITWTTGDDPTGVGPKSKHSEML